MEPHEPPPFSPQVEVTISLEIRLFHHYCSSNRLTVVDNHHLTVFPRQQTLRFDAHVFKNQQLASMFLGSMLTSLGLLPEYPDFHFVIDKIMRHGVEISNFIITSELIEPVVLGLRAELQQRVVSHIDYENGSDFSVGRAMEESELDFERVNYGMVPAEESSVKKELKKVRAQGGGDCMICLQELEVSSFALQMPCAHAFHAFNLSCSQRALQTCCFARRRVRYDDEDEEINGGEGGDYGYNEEIAMLELYSQSARGEALLIHAIVDEQEVEVLIFKGFSSNLTCGTSPDPSRSVIPARAVIKSIDRIKGPFDPSNIEYIEKGLEWESFKTRLAPT
ncbi:hypothetical protein CCACVL1_23937 [Corchorus capsularis]|uniref:Uncharacterized protein n=1 Tax=Corchorus capsularis TaxID=210143 RepID=A0A1R3GRH4_COCAP|nr:hypothetical protein CCACVL1_23937 [Corchorus capsularis]